MKRWRYCLLSKSCVSACQYEMRRRTVCTLFPPLTHALQLSGSELTRCAREATVGRSTGLREQLTSTKLRMEADIRRRRLQGSIWPPPAARCRSRGGRGRGGEQPMGSRMQDQTRGSQLTSSTQRADLLSPSMSGYQVDGALARRVVLAESATARNHVCGEQMIGKGEV